MQPLKLIVLAISTSLVAASCSGPAYVASTPPPPPPVYSQAPPPQDQAAPAQTVSYQSFYDELSPYGQWVNTPDYGYVWVPAAGPDFQPYASNGHWVLTNYGWTWASDYSWGWAPFHYGTWDFDGTLGWYWIPGYQWSPAWVSWRSCNGYYGWAPLGPGYVNGEYANYNCPTERYVFVNARYMNDPNVGRYYEPRSQSATYFSRSTVVTNTYYDRGSNNTYYSGPQSAEVERYTGTPVRPVTIVQASSPERAGVSGNQLSMFRPSVQQPRNDEANRPAPQRIYQRTEVTPVAQRQVLTRPNQPRVAPFKPENTQRSVNQSNEQNRQQEQQHAPVQQQPQRDGNPVQQHPATQQRTPVQQRAPMQQQHSAKQKPQRQKKGKPQKQSKPQSKQQKQSQQGGQQQGK